MKENENCVIPVIDEENAPLKNEVKCEDPEYEISLDQILDKIGYTSYHILMLAIVGLSLASDGVEIYLIYLISPVLKRIYNLNDHSVSIIVSSLFLGIAIGAVTSGILVREHGRRKVMLFFITLISVFGTVCVLIENVYWFLICRFIIGISVGVLFNLTNALCEILPNKYRDFLMGSIYFYVKFGIVFFVFVFYVFTLETDPIHNYKQIVIVSSTPMYICLILSYFFYEESPRILFLNEAKYEEGFKIIEKMAKGSDYKFTEKDKQGLVRNLKRNRSDDSMMDGEDHNPFGILSSLFRKKYLKLFVLVIICWSINVVVLFTNLYSLPILLNKESEAKKHPDKIFGSNFTHNNKMNVSNINLTNNINLANTTITTTIISEKESEADKKEREQKIRKILIANLIPIPAEVLAGLLTSSALLGRKYTMSVGFFFEMVFAILMFFDHEYLHFHSSMIIFFNVLSFNICKLYTTEAFHTKKRDTAYGFSNFVSRIATVFIPYMANLAFLYSDYGPCIFMAILSFLGVLVSVLLPFDTYNRPLDKEETVAKTM